LLSRKERGDSSSRRVREKGGENRDDYVILFTPDQRIIIPIENMPGGLLGVGPELFLATGASKKRE